MLAGSMPVAFDATVMGAKNGLERRGRRTETRHGRIPPHVLVAGGGIGGLAAALALARQGFEVEVLEQSTEIGAGIQLGPNAFAA